MRPDGKPALTKFRVLATSPDADLTVGRLGYRTAPEVAQHTRGVALILCEPMTGRTHQIRVHLAHVGHPILGDEIYGVNGPWLDRQALHAATLSLQHPRTQEALTIRAPVPGDFAAAMEMVGLGHAVDFKSVLKP